MDDGAAVRVKTHTKKEHIQRLSMNVVVVVVRSGRLSLTVNTTGPIDRSIDGLRT